MMFQTAPILASWYELFKWTIVAAPPTEKLVTSDSPVIKRAPRGSTFGLGVMNPELEVVFPLASSAFLLMTHDSEREEQYAELIEAGEKERAFAFVQETLEVERKQADSSVIRNVNALVAEYADECVYAQTRNPWLFKILKRPAGGNRTHVS